MGGTIGRLIGDGLKRIVPEPWTLIAAGAGAGLAVAFNAPLAAALFVTEELLHRFSPRTFSATLVACLTGTVILRQIVGNATDFNVAPVGNIPADVLPEYLLLGVLAGFLGVLFNISLLATLNAFDRVRIWPRAPGCDRWGGRRTARVAHPVPCRGRRRSRSTHCQAGSRGT